MQLKSAIAAAKILSKVSSAEDKVVAEKSRIERCWRYFVTLVETFWSFFKSSLEKVEEAWRNIRYAIENAWNSIWGVTFDVKSEVDSALLRVPVTSSTGFGRRVGICIGLLYVDRRVYGTDANCPGCDKDAVSMNRILSKYGFETKLFLNNNATWYNINNALAKYASELNSGDLIVITAAGHGGQVRDENGDEADGLDETWLLYDKEVPDDDILSAIKKLKSGVRVVLINDQCHSEGNFRSVMRGIQRMVSFGMWGKRDGHPIVQGCGDECQVDASYEYGPALIQFAGCRESNVSYGSSNGGEWTSALITSFSPELSWREWFDRASKIPRKQVPQWVEYGPVNDNFRNGRVFL